MRSDTLKTEWVVSWKFLIGLTLIIIVPVLILTLSIFSHIQTQYHHQLDELLYLKTHEIHLKPSLQSVSVSETPEDWNNEWLVLPIQKQGLSVSMIVPSPLTDVGRTLMQWEDWLLRQQEPLTQYWQKVHDPWQTHIHQIPVRCLIAQHHSQDNQAYLVCLRTVEEQWVQSREMQLVGGMVIMMLVLSFGGLVWFHYAAILPFSQLTQGCIQLAGGNLETQLSLKTPIKSLQKGVKAFNQMVLQLKANRTHDMAMLASLTHDFKTPLIAERRVLSQLEQHPETVNTYLSALQQNNNLLLRLTDDLMDSCQWALERIPVNRVWCNFPELVQSTHQALTPLLDEHQSTLEFSDSLEVPLWADAHLVRRLLFNLLANAIEHGDTHNKIQLHIQHTQQTAIISIEDTGPGLPETVIEAIQKTQWQQATGSLLLGIGSGLGLSICHQIVTAHHGQLSVHNKASGGTHWQLQFPLPPHTHPSASDMSDQITGDMREAG